MSDSSSGSPAPAAQLDASQLLTIIQAQIQASAQRDAQLQTLLQTMSNSRTAAPATTSTTKPVSVDRPILLASATLADYASWCEAWSDYARCQLLASQPRETRMAAFRQALDEDLRRFVREGIIPIPDSHDVLDAMDELKKFIRRQRNPLLDRIDFYRRSQQPGESFDAWYASLRELFHACNFSELSMCSTCPARVCSTCSSAIQSLSDDILRDRVVTGILSDDVRHKLLATKALTLTSCVDLCRSEEAASHTTSGIPGQVPRGSAVNAMKSSYQKEKKSSSQAPKKPDAAAKASSSSKPPGPVNKCHNCGRTAHTKSECPAAGRKCNGCQRMGHFLATCPAAKKTVGQLKLQRAISSRDASTIVVDTQLVSASEPTSLRWLPDTGSDVDAIGLAHLSTLGEFPENLPADRDVVCTANGSALTSLGKLNATLTLGSATHSTVVHVYDSLDEALLSRNSLSALNLLPAAWPSVSVQSLSADTSTVEQLQQQLLDEFADVFDSSCLNPMDGPPMDIKLKPDAEPSCVRNA
eukprot:scpid17310/ scgid17953/ 